MGDRQLQSGQIQFRALMESAQWTGAETARRLGISHAAVYLILHGRNNPKNTTLELLRRLVDEERQKFGPRNAIKEQRSAAASPPQVSPKPKSMSIIPADSPERSPLIDTPISEATDLVEKLAFLRQQTPEKYRAARAIIEALYRESKSARHTTRGPKKK